MQLYPPAVNPEIEVERSAYGVAVSNLDGDGDLDLVAANYDSYSVSVRLNDGTGNFPPVHGTI